MNNHSYAPASAFTPDAARQRGLDCVEQSSRADFYIFTNNESNFALLFANSSNVSMMKDSCPLSI